MIGRFVCLFPYGSSDTIRAGGRLPCRLSCFNLLELQRRLGDVDAVLQLWRLGNRLLFWLSFVKMLFWQLPPGPTPTACRGSISVLDALIGDWVQAAPLGRQRWRIKGIVTADVSISMQMSEGATIRTRLQRTFYPRLPPRPAGYDGNMDCATLVNTGDAS